MGILSDQTSQAENRDAEESRIVANYLQKIEDAVGPERNRVYRAALDDAGLDGGSVMKRTGLNQTHYDRVIQFVQEKYPQIILDVYSQLTFLDLGVLGYAALSSGTVKRGIEILRRFHEITTDAYELRIESEESATNIYPLARFDFMHKEQFVAEDCLAGMWRTLLLLTNDDSALKQAQVSFAFAPPDHFECYQDYFGCRVKFGADRSQLTIPNRIMGYKVTTGHDVMADSCTAMCERVLGPTHRESDIVRLTRRLLISQPGGEILQLDQAADQLRLSPSQLRKRLYRAGTSFKKIALEVRMMLAQQYLRETVLPVQEIAYLLGYSQPAPFSRAFSSFTGMSPVNFRGTTLEYR